MYYVYITTNKAKTVLYTGMSNNVSVRLDQHGSDAQMDKKTFAGKYNCVYLLYYEEYQWVRDAIAREKEIKGWTRKKKIALIMQANPEMVFLNEY